MITIYTFLDNTFLENLLQHIDIFLNISLIIFASLSLIYLAGKNLGEKTFKIIVGTNAALAVLERLGGGAGGSSNNNDKKDDKKDDKKNDKKDESKK